MRIQNESQLLMHLITPSVCPRAHKVLITVATRHMDEQLILR